MKRTVYDKAARYLMKRYFLVPTRDVKRVRLEQRARGRWQ